MPQPNGPRPGRTHGRLRRTLTNRGSKTVYRVASGGGGAGAVPAGGDNDARHGGPQYGQQGGGGGGRGGGGGGGGGGGFVPAVSPGSAAAYSATLQALTQQRAQQLAAIRAAAAAARGEFQVTRADIRQQLIGGLTTVENEALDRGIFGSSADLENRAEVEAAAAAAKQQARTALLSRLAELKQQRAQAQTDFLLGVANVAAQRAAEQSQMAATAYEQNTISGPVRGQDAGIPNYLQGFTKELPKWYTPKLVTWHGTTLNVDAMRALQAASRELGQPITGGGYRSYEQQASLDRDGDGIKDGTSGVPVAAPGSSYHQAGLAIDLAPQFQNERVFAILRKYGFRQLAGEPWHWTYRLYG